MPVTLPQISAPAAPASGSGLAGLASTALTLFGGGAGPVGALAGAVLGPDDVKSYSGMGDFNAAGINVGSKVIGSGSAATTIPPAINAPKDGSSVYSAPASSSAVSGAPVWLIPAIIGAVLLGLLLIFKRK